jgi:hypothetical protein
MPNATASFCIALIIACAIQAQGRPLHTYARGGASAFATSNGEGSLPACCCPSGDSKQCRGQPSVV